MEKRPTDKEYADFFPNKVFTRSQIKRRKKLEYDLKLGFNSDGELTHLVVMGDKGEKTDDSLSV